MNRLLKSIRLKNFLSYGPTTADTELSPLNVVIGPNGSGKSNLIEAIDVLRSTPSDVTRPIREGGGVQDWLWKGLSPKRTPVAEIDTTVYFPEGVAPLR
jgi:predicted ATPase